MTTVKSQQLNSTESPIINNTSSNLAVDPITEERQKYILAYTMLMVTLVVVILKAEFSFFYALMRSVENRSTVTKYQTNSTFLITEHRRIYISKCSMELQIHTCPSSIRILQEES